MVTNTISTAVRRSRLNVRNFPVSDEDRRPAAAGRAGWKVAAVSLSVAFAAAAVVSGLDRAALDEPAALRKVPKMLAVGAQIARGNALFNSGRYREAAEVARIAVRRAPVEPESTALLGGALLGLNDEGGAERAFLVAGRLGWRTPLTQYYWMRQALLVNDLRVASLRADAMLRQNPGLVGQPGLLEPLESSEAGRAELAERMRDNPEWVQHYAQDIYGVPAQAIAMRAQVLNVLAAKGGVVGCTVIGTIVTALVAGNNVPLAQRVWSAHCPQRRPSSANGLLSDSGFNGLQVRRAESPFDWSVVGDSDVSLSLDEQTADKDRRLLIASSAAFPRKVLTQLAPLSPGPFRLSWRAQGEAGTPSPRLMATVSCAQDGQWIEGVSDGKGGYRVDFDVDGACPARWVSFAVKPGSGSVQFSDVRLFARR